MADASKKIKCFTLEEARALLPYLQEAIENANAELEKHWLTLQDLNQAYEKAESAVDAIRLGNGDEIDELRSRRATFQKAIDDLGAAQSTYLSRLNYWIDEITQEGVILRDLRDGLLDFPARKDDFDYYLCWKSGEDDICHWHLITDGYMGRKPLATLTEY